VALDTAVAGAVLMDQKHVDPTLGAHRPLELDLLLAESGVEAVLPDVAQRVQGQVCVPLAKQQRFHHNLVEGGLPAKVVDQVARL
jgi:hypothetical protein